MQDRPRPERDEIYSAWQEPSDWITAQLFVDGDVIDGSYWACPTGEWCLSAQTSTGVLVVSGAQLRPDDIQIRTVTEWSAYGIDLTSPQAAAAFERRAAEVRTQWEHVAGTS